MKRKLAVAATLALVLGLVALNLRMRAEGELAAEPRSEAPPEGSPQAPPAPDAGVRDAGARARPSGEPAQAQAEGEGEGEPAAPAPDGCDHPLVPARAGQWRLYRMSSPSTEQAARILVRARRTRVLEDGQREVVWLVRADAEEGDERLARMTLRTRCRPGEDAEEPWFGILERSIGLRLTRRTRRWRWPASLRPGLSFRGTATLDPSHADARLPEGVEEGSMLTVTRNHLVAGREEVEVPAGRFDAWRVAYEERQSIGSHGETGDGTMWVAEDVGLVRSRAENSRGVVQTMELVRFGDD